jgi:chemotaxis protein methyltransferase CheR
MTPPTERDVLRFCAIVESRLGLVVDETRLDDAAACLRDRLAAAGASAVPYLEALGDAPARGELRAIATALTVGETYFFRNPSHFRAFTEHAVPDRLAAREAPLRVLSAGCASGEEAYTVALALLTHPAAAALSSARIVGIDANPSVLDKARSGRYTPWSLRATPDDVRDRWFTRQGAELVLDPEVCRRVTFEERNLLDDDLAFWAPDSFDVVFCRNVLIYFSHDAVCRVIGRIAAALSRGGFLFLGDAENLRGVSQEFQLHHDHGTFYYQARHATAAVPRARVRSEPDVPVPPRALAPDVSWVEAIQGASERIAHLAAVGAPRSALPKAPPPVVDPYAAAMLLLQQERFVDALAALDAAPGGDPETALLRAALLVNSGDMAGARVACESLLAVDELCAGAHYLLALCREHAGELDAAREHDECAAYLDPAFAMPRLHLGRLLRRRGDLVAAHAELARALDLLGREQETRIALFGGGFRRPALLQIVRAELGACGEPR